MSIRRGLRAPLTDNRPAFNDHTSSHRCIIAWEDFTLSDWLQAAASEISISEANIRVIDGSMFVAKQ
jgi:hypothetical protein